MRQAINTPKILLYDIETMANLAYVWGLWEQDVISVVKPWYILSFAYKWLGEKSIHYYSLPDFKGYKNDKSNDKELCHKLWELMDEADIVVSHNGTAFDSKKAMAKFAQHGFPPPTPYQQVDTLTVAKKYFKFDSNKLDNIAQYFGLGKKINTGGFELWEGCADKADKKAWYKMTKYNMHDVRSLEQIYYKFLPYMDNHPNYNLFGAKEVCPNCGGKLQRRGYSITRVSKFQRFQCQSCGAWSKKPINGIVR
jgi:DNA polymerase elongation subunit (family B)